MAYFGEISSLTNKASKWVDSKYLLPIFLLGPAVILVFSITILPIMYGFWLSLQSSGFGIADLEWAGTLNYENLIQGDSFWFSLEKGLIYAAYSVGLQTIAGVGIALILNRTFKFVNIVRTIVLIPYLIPTIAVALVWEWILNNQYGLVNYLLELIGLIGAPLHFFSSGMAMHSVVWISSWKFTIFVVLIVLARLQSIDQELYEMAKINGAGYIRCFFDVTLPNIRSTLLLVILLRGIWMFNKFDMIWLLTQGGPFEETKTLAILAYKSAFESLNYSEGAAIAVLMFLILLGIAIIYFYRFKPEQEVET